MDLLLRLAGYGHTRQKSVFEVHALFLVFLFHLSEYSSASLQIVIKTIVCPQINEEYCWWRVELRLAVNKVPSLRHYKGAVLEHSQAPHIYPASSKQLLVFIIGTFFYKAVQGKDVVFVPPP